jgi:hypothetical protein
VSAADELHGPSAEWINGRSDFLTAARVLAASKKLKELEHEPA